MWPIHRKLGGEPLRLLVRHADAGTRRGSPEPDQWRGLSRTGQAQAEELVSRLVGLPITRVLSSPALRCRQTVVPLARRLSLGVEACRWLAEDGDPAELMRLLSAPETEYTVFCTHRRVLLEVFAGLARTGSRLVDGVVRMEMAAAWQLVLTDGTPTRLRLMYPAEPSGRAPG